MDRIRPNWTEENRVDRIEPMWTEYSRRGGWERERGVPSWSHISDDPASKATIYKTIPIANKAPLSKLTSCLIYISHIPNETWSISFVKFNTSSSILLKLLLMCGYSTIAIATEIYFLTAIKTSNFRQSAKPIQGWLVGHFTPILKQIKLKFNGKHTLTIDNIESRY